MATKVIQALLPIYNIVYSRALVFFFLKKILFIFRQKGREGEREGETSMCG